MIENKYIQGQVEQTFELGKPKEDQQKTRNKKNTNTNVKTTTTKGNTNDVDKGSTNDVETNYEEKEEKEEKNNIETKDTKTLDDIINNLEKGITYQELIDISKSTKDFEAKIRDNNLVLIKNRETNGETYYYVNNDYVNNVNKKDEKEKDKKDKLTLKSIFEKEKYITIFCHGTCAYNLTLKTNRELCNGSAIFVNNLPRRHDAVGVFGVPTTKGTIERSKKQYNVISEILKDNPNKQTNISGNSYGCLMAASIAKNILEEYPERKIFLHLRNIGPDYTNISGLPGPLAIKNLLEQIPEKQRKNLKIHIEIEKGDAWHHSRNSKQLFNDLKKLGFNVFHAITKNKKSKQNYLYSPLLDGDLIHGKRSVFNKEQKETIEKFFGTTYKDIEKKRKKDNNKGIDVGFMINKDYERAFYTNFDMNNINKMNELVFNNPNAKIMKHIDYNDFDITISYFISDNERKRRFIIKQISFNPKTKIITIHETKGATYELVEINLTTGKIQKDIYEKTNKNNQNKIMQIIKTSQIMNNTEGKKTLEWLKRTYHITDPQSIDLGNLEKFSSKEEWGSFPSNKYEYEKNNFNHQTENFKINYKIGRPKEVVVYDDDTKNCVSIKDNNYNKVTGEINSKEYNIKTKNTYNDYIFNYESKVSVDTNTKDKTVSVDKNTKDESPTYKYNNEHFFINYNIEGSALLRSGNITKDENGNEIVTIKSRNEKNTRNNTTIKYTKYKELENEDEINASTNIGKNENTEKDIDYTIDMTLEKPLSFSYSETRRGPLIGYEINNFKIISKKNESIPEFVFTYKDKDTCKDNIIITTKNGKNGEIYLNFKISDNKEYSVKIKTDKDGEDKISLKNDKNEYIEMDEEELENIDEKSIFNFIKNVTDDNRFYTVYNTLLSGTKDEDLGGCYSGTFGYTLSLMSTKLVEIVDDIQSHAEEAKKEIPSALKKNDKILQQEKIIAELNNKQSELKQTEEILKIIKENNHKYEDNIVENLDSVLIPEISKVIDGKINSIKEKIEKENIQDEEQIKQKVGMYLNDILLSFNKKRKENEIEKKLLEIMEDKDFIDNLCNFIENTNNRIKSNKLSKEDKTKKTEKYKEFLKNKCFKKEELTFVDNYIKENKLHIDEELSSQIKDRIIDICLDLQYENKQKKKELERIKTQIQKQEIDLLYTIKISRQNKTRTIIDDKEMLNNLKQQEAQINKELEKNIKNHIIKIRTELQFKHQGISNENEQLNKAVFHTLHNNFNEIWNKATKKKNRFENGAKNQALEDEGTILIKKKKNEDEGINTIAIPTKKQKNKKQNSVEYLDFVNRYTKNKNIQKKLKEKITEIKNKISLNSIKDIDKIHEQVKQEINKLIETLEKDIQTKQKEIEKEENNKKIDKLEPLSNDILSYKKRNNRKQKELENMLNSLEQEAKDAEKEIREIREIPETYINTMKDLNTIATEAKDRVYYQDKFANENKEFLKNYNDKITKNLVFQLLDREITKEELIQMITDIADGKTIAIKKLNSKQLLSDARLRVKEIKDYIDNLDKNIKEDEKKIINTNKISKMETEWKQLKNEYTQIKREYSEKAENYYKMAYDDPKKKELFINEIQPLEQKIDKNLNRQQYLSDILNDNNKRLENIRKTRKRISNLNRHPVIKQILGMHSYYLKSKNDIGRFNNEFPNDDFIYNEKPARINIDDTADKGLDDIIDKIDEIDKDLLAQQYYENINIKIIPTKDDKNSIKNQKLNEELDEENDNSFNLYRGKQCCKIELQYNDKENNTKSNSDNWTVTFKKDDEYAEINKNFIKITDPNLEDCKVILKDDEVIMKYDNYVCHYTLDKQGGVLTKINTKEYEISLKTNKNIINNHFTYIENEKKPLKFETKENNEKVEELKKTLFENKGLYFILKNDCTLNQVFAPLTIGCDAIKTEYSDDTFREFIKIYLAKGREIRQNLFKEIDKQFVYNEQNKKIILKTKKVLYNVDGEIQLKEVKQNKNNTKSYAEKTYAKKRISNMKVEQNEFPSRCHMIVEKMLEQEQEKRIQKKKEEQMKSNIQNKEINNEANNSLSYKNEGIICTQNKSCIEKTNSFKQENKEEDKQNKSCINNDEYEKEQSKINTQIKANTNTLNRNIQK